MNVSTRAAKAGMLMGVLCASLGFMSPGYAESDKELAEKAIKQREMFRQGGDMDHSQHALPGDKGKYRGVFYGYLPCNEPDCNGIKMTLSLNAKDNYLLVIQPAKLLNRESFEKGKYTWDEANRTVVLTPNKEAPVRKLQIKEDGALLYVNSDGRPYPGSEKPYLMERSDLAGNREMHIH